MHLMQPNETAASQQISQHLGEAVRAAREASGRNQAQLAQDLGRELRKDVTPTTITRLEKGKRPTPITEVYALAKVLGVSLSTLLPPAEPLAQLMAPFQFERELLALRKEQLEAEQEVTKSRWQVNSVALDAADRIGRHLSGVEPLDHEPLSSAIQVLFLALYRRRSDPEFPFALADALGVPEGTASKADEQFRQLEGEADNAGAHVDWDAAYREMSEEFAEDAASFLLTGRAHGSA